MTQGLSSSWKKEISGLSPLITLQALLFHNKGVYLKVGLQKISHTRNLHKEIKLQVDQHEVELPNIEGLIFINIPSWGSGADLWGSDNDNRFEKPRIDDGLLEVVGVTGVVHMGQVQGGLRSGIRIAQGSYFRLTLLKPIPVQVDGEPWIQPPGQIIISVAGPKWERVEHILESSVDIKGDFWQHDSCWWVWLYEQTSPHSDFSG
ncbi:hypothetical protein lerEdw1_002833 [Lerista edwardsae]|nr:hypothetical protein lerEdw1_002833 [Lerista edwardsae]